jgi:hypothetical protein
VFGPYLLRAAVDTVLAGTRAPAAAPAALAALAGYGIGTSTGAVTFSALLQATAPRHPMPGAGSSPASI